LPSGQRTGCCGTRRRDRIENGARWTQRWQYSANAGDDAKLFFEESGLPYVLVPIDTLRGEQHKLGFRAINPNDKVPAIVDGDAIVFDSNAILLYLAEKTGKFLPENTPAARGRLYSRRLFVGTGIGPYSGQAVHVQASRVRAHAAAVCEVEIKSDEQCIRLLRTDQQGDVLFEFIRRSEVGRVGSSVAFSLTRKPAHHRFRASPCVV